MCATELKWTVHLAKQERAKAMVVVAVALLSGVLSAMILGGWLAFLIGPIVVFGSAAEFLIPVHFKLNQDGASRRCFLSVSHIEWADVKRVLEDESGVKLSPLPDSSRMAPFRGVFLRPIGNRQEILDCISYWRGKHAEDVGSASVGG